MRIHFLQNVSHSAAHYQRNEKGMMRGGNSDKEGTKEREGARVARKRRAGDSGGGRRDKGPVEGKRERTGERRTEGEASLNIS